MQQPIPQSHNSFAAIYARISSDKSGMAAGVERQQADCRALAERLGLNVTHVLVDNDVSAYSGKPRPNYRRLLELMKDGEIGTVLAFHHDRLQRSLTELEEYVDISEAGHVTTHTVLAGHIDLSTPSGRFNARIIGAAARYEVEHMIERQRAAKLQAAKDGKFLGGQRPYGFEPQRTAIREDEAKVIKEMADRLVDGESYNTIAIDVNKRGLKTKHGKAWLPINVENTLKRHINAGIVFHHGIEYKAQTPAIFTEDEWSQLQAAIRLRAIQSRQPGRFRRHLLNGLIFCGECGAQMYHKNKQMRDGSYKTTSFCGKIDGRTGERIGCGHVARLVDPIIDLVSDAVIYRLDSPQLLRAMKRRKAGAPELAKLLTRQGALNGRVAQMSNDYYVRGLLKPDEYERLKIETDAELRDIELSIEKATRSTALPRISISGDIRTAWESASVEWKRDLLFQVISAINVHPKPRVEGYYPPKYKDWWFDPELIEIRWKV